MTKPDTSQNTPNKKLSNDDIDKLDKAKKKYFKTRFGIETNYSTSGLDLMASPLKQSLIYSAFIIACVILFRYLGLLKFIIRLDHIYIYAVLLIFFLFYFYIKQKIQNSNIEYSAKQFGYIPNYHNLEYYKPNSNNSILNDLWRIMLGHLIIDFIVFNFTKPEWFNKASENYLHSYKKH